MKEKISINGIDKAVIKDGKSFQILRDVSFFINQGEIACILGPSGCGKSTLLRLAAGFDKPDKGTIRIDGNELPGPSADSILVFQDFNQLLPWKTVMENVLYPLKVNGIGSSKKEREAIAAANLEMVGLEDFRSSYPHQLSGGMKQKAALARALAVKPSVLLMDEPFGSLDAMTRNKMQSLLLEIWRKTGVTIAFVTHDVQEAIILGDRIILMDKNPGRIHNILQNQLERPRDIGSPGFAQMYDKTYGMLEGLDNQ
ncbi:MAG TPA: ABC transporter ATP-binding protein [Negativicutes bacterium]|nr:ABC transporter ATP-binding protein [Negativicutes bacterium]